MKLSIDKGSAEVVTQTVKEISAGLLPAQRPSFTEIDSWSYVAYRRALSEPPKEASRRRFFPCFTARYTYHVHSIKASH